MVLNNLPLFPPNHHHYWLPPLLFPSGVSALPMNFLLGATRGSEAFLVGKGTSQRACTGVQVVRDTAEVGMQRTQARKQEKVTCGWVTDCWSPCNLPAEFTAGNGCGTAGTEAEFRKMGRAATANLDKRSKTLGINVSNSKRRTAVSITGTIQA